jgi:hypothetical protein
MSNLVARNDLAMIRGFSGWQGDPLYIQRDLLEAGEQILWPGDR